MGAAHVARAGQAAVFASEEFFFGTVRNPHTRAAYLTAVRKFLAWGEGQGIALERITPRDAGRYFDQLRDISSIATRKQHLTTLRHYFDGLLPAMPLS